MDSLKVSGTSFASMGVVFMELLPYFIGVSIGIMYIVYLYYKIKKIKES